MPLIDNKDLPVRMKERQKIAHDIAKQSCEQIWNIAIQAHKQIGSQITGTDALSYTATILQHFAGRWISFMDRIRLADDSGITREHLVKEIINGILATIGVTASFDEDLPLPGGIQRLKKESDNESDSIN